MAGEGFTHSDKAYYRHDTLPNDCLQWGILEEDSASDLAQLYELRIRADYWEDRVDLEEASEAFDIASEIVSTILGAAQ